MYELFVKLVWLWNEHSPLYKNEYNGTPHEVSVHTSKRADTSPGELTQLTERWHITRKADTSSGERKHLTESWHTLRRADTSRGELTHQQVNGHTLRRADTSRGELTPRGGSVVIRIIHTHTHIHSSTVEYVGPNRELSHAVIGNMLYIQYRSNTTED